MGGGEERCGFSHPSAQADGPLARAGLGDESLVGDACDRSAECKSLVERELLPGSHDRDVTELQVVIS